MEIDSDRQIATACRRLSLSAAAFAAQLEAIGHTTPERLSAVQTAVMADMAAAQLALSSFRPTRKT